MVHREVVAIVVVAIVVVAMQPLLGGLPYLTSLMILCCIFQA